MKIAALEAAIFLMEENLSLTEPNDSVAAFALLRDIVAELNQGDYIPSAAGVKNAMLSRQPAFSERALGFRKFVDFLDAATQAGIVSVLRDPNNHPRIFPVGRPVERVEASIRELNALSHGSRKLKSDVWRAFVSWGPRDYWRFWDRREARVFMAPTGQGLEAPWQSDPTRFAEIAQVARELQIQWMREFAQARPLAEREALLTSVAPDAPNGEFSRTLRRLHLTEDWTLELQSRVSRHVEAWALKSSVGLSRLLESRRADERESVVSSSTVTNSDPSENLRKTIHAAVDKMTRRELESLLVPARVIVR